MKEIKINIKSISDVKEIVNIFNSQKADVDLISGRYIVDGKSIMGIFSLDLLNPVILRINSDNDADINTLIENIDKFIVKE